jgi:hypothetical protein
MHQHATADPASTATGTTPTVTVDPFTDAHRALYPNLLGDFAYAVAVYRNGILADVIAHGPDASDLAQLRQIAQQAARENGWTYQACEYCGINCAPDVRAEHEHLDRQSETTWRRQVAA